MKLFLSAQTKVCDTVTCENQNITEKDLIQRAGISFVENLQNTGEDLSGKIVIFAGPGNNGADGISIAKNLYSKFHDVELVLIPLGKQYSDAFKFYLDNPVDQQPFPVHIIKDAKQLNDIEDPDVFIDAILGTGFNREPDKLLNSVIEYMRFYFFKVRRIILFFPAAIAVVAFIKRSVYKEESELSSNQETPPSHE